MGLCEERCITAAGFEDASIIQYLGVVEGTSRYNCHGIFSLAADSADAIEEAFLKAKGLMREKASRRGADAVVAMSMSMTPLATGGTTQHIYVSVVGTAVKIKEKDLAFLNDELPDL